MPAQALGEGVAVDLGIAGRWATVCASVQGPGRACAEALAAEGVNIVVNGREPTEVAQAAAEIAAAHRVEVRAVPADPATEAGLGQLLAACPGPDILVTEMPRRESADQPARADALDAALRAQYLEQQCWACLALVKAVIDGMRSRRFGRIVNIAVAEPPVRRLTSAVPWDGRSGLTAVMRGLAEQVAADNVTINELVMGQGATQSGGPGCAAAGATCAIVCGALSGSISGIDLRPAGDHRGLRLVS